MRRVWLCGLSLLLTSAAQGQSDSARIAALEAKVALLDSIISSKGFLAPRWPCEEKEARRPSTYFPNGEYNLEYRNRQFGCFAGKVVDDVAGLQAQVSGLATRLAAVESRSGLGRTIRADTLILGTCKTTSNQMLQLCGDKNAEFRLVANQDGTNPQGASAHEHLFGAQADGGIRLEFNWVCHGGEVVTVDNGACWIEPSKPRRILGFDSQGTLSFSDDQYPHIDNSQTFVLQLDRASKFADWQLMKAGWVWRLGTSTCTNCFDKKYIVPQQ